MKTINTILTIIIILLIIGAGYWIYRSYKPVTVNNTDVNINSATTTPSDTFTLISSAFSDGQSIPVQYTCDGDGINPPLSFNNPPAGTQSFALTMYDPDVPTQVRAQGFFDHWVIFNIPATTTGIMASSTVGTPGSNSSGKLGYTPPCPPSQYEPKEHRYIFTLYAFDSNLSLPRGASRDDVENASSTIIGKTVLMGKYQSQSK